jgi:hypothetical protein
MQKTSITDRAAFLNWRYEVRGNADKPTKPPYSARDNYPVGTDEADRHRLTLYADALKNQAVGKPHSNIEPERGYDGVGFVFTRFNDTLYICGIDIDHQDPAGAFVARIKAMFPNAYMELSPSGEGIHIIMLVDISRIPTERVTDNGKERVKLHKQYYSKNPHNGVECYIAELTNRYFTFTGKTIQDVKDIDQTDEFLRFLTAYMTRQSKQASGAAEPNAGNAPLDLSDDEILMLARNAANGAKFIALYDNGDLSPYSGDESGADMGLMNMLAFWTRCNPVQMERLFSNAQLGQREKWQRADYRRMTIERAIADCREVYEPGYYKTDAQTDFEPWGEIIPLDTLTPPPFPLECLPVTIGNYARAVSEYTQTDPSMAGVAQLGLLGTLFQNKLHVQSVNGNIEQTSIDAVVILPPAERKSEVIRLTVKPVNKFESEYNTAHRAELSRNKAEKTLRQKALDAAQRAKDTDIDTLCRAQAAVDNFRELKPLTLVADDTTIEALISLMKDNGERMLIASDEGGLFAHMKGRYKLNGDDMEIYLKAHSGGRVSVHRKSREPEVLENPALSMIIAVQPYVIENCVLDEENNGRGLTARFVYACCEERAGTRVAVSGRIPEDIAVAYERAVEKCLRLTVGEADFLETDYTQLRIMQLSEEARAYAIEYFDTCERRIVEGLERAKGWNGKCFGLAVRIAGLFHAFEYMERGQDPAENLISLETMQKAAIITETLAIHAEKVFMGTDRKNTAAHHLLKVLGAFRDVSEINKQEVWQKAKRRYQSAEAFDEALQTLESNHYIRTQTIQTKGRPKTIIKLNPQGQAF